MKIKNLKVTRRQLDQATGLAVGGTMLAAVASRSPQTAIMGAGLAVVLYGIDKRRRRR